MNGWLFAEASLIWPFLISCLLATMTHGNTQLVLLGISLLLCAAVVICCIVGIWKHLRSRSLDPQESATKASGGEG